GNLNGVIALIGARAVADEILFSPASMRALGSYRAWLRSSIDAIARGGRIRAPELRRSWGENPRTRRQEIDHLRVRIAKEVPHVHTVMRRMVSSGQISEERCLLAIYRTIQPLLDARESGFVERHVDE